VSSIIVEAGDDGIGTHGGENHLNHMIL